MSDTATYMALVGEELRMPGLDALHVPLVLGNHMIAISYQRRDIKFRFRGQKIRL